MKSKLIFKVYLHRTLIQAENTLNQYELYEFSPRRVVEATRFRGNDYDVMMSPLRMD